jgi:membrane dipeptidase
MAQTQWSDKYLILDAHCDSLILRYDRDDPMDFADVNPMYHIDLPRLRAGGVGCLFCMVGDNDLQQSGILIDAAYEICRRHEDDFEICLNATDVRNVRAENKIAIVLTIEGQKMFNESIGQLRNYHRLGVRLASITHGAGGRPELQYDKSYYDYISVRDREDLRRGSKGLTPFARESLEEMARLHIPVDVAHINDAAFWEIMETADCPVCYTHGCCYALTPHARNLSDEMMKALAEKGGVMGITFYPPFVHQTEPTLDRLCDHFVHACEVIGPDHVGIGTDFDGMPGPAHPIPEDVSKLEMLFEALARRGLDEQSLRLIAGESFLGLLEP